MTKTSGTKEWSDASENCISGCSNNCRYCYGMNMAVQYKRETKETWPIEHPRTTAKAKKHKGRTMFPTTHDLHFEHVNWWGPYLRKLLELGNDVLIVSKPQLNSIRYICDRYYSAPCKLNMEFRFTIGTSDQQVADYWEPGAPKLWQRIESLQLAFNWGFKTSVSMEPLMMEYPVGFIETFLLPSVTGEIWIGCMNHYAFKPEIPEEARQMRIQSRENMQRVYDALKDNPKVRWKDSIRNLLELKES